MIKKVLCLLTNLLWVGTCMLGKIRFSLACFNLKRTQEKVLTDILKANVASEVGRQYNFAGVNSVRQFQTVVPVGDYDDLAEDINKLAAGARGVLTEQPVLLFEPTSGSAAASKYIPYTKSLQVQFNAAIAPWIGELYLQYPSLFFCVAYWSLTPVNVRERFTLGGIPVGFEDDSEYLGKVGALLRKNIFAVPSEVKLIPEIGDFRYVTLLFLLKQRNLGLISVWNPTYLLLLLEELDAHWDSLIDDLQQGRISGCPSIEMDLRLQLAKKLGQNQVRAEELRLLVQAQKQAREQEQKLNVKLNINVNAKIDKEGAQQQERKFGQKDSQKDNRKKSQKYSRMFSQAKLSHKVWPWLKVISCWTEANAALFVPEIKRLFPNVHIQGKGLIATEGIVSIPMGSQEGAVLAINSHFFEFETEDGRILSAWQVEKGYRYNIIITTGGGLYRYRLDDLVEVCGFYKKVPRLRFIGKAAQISDICGEKLSELHVRNVLEEALVYYGMQADFYLAAPEIAERPRYILFLQLSVGACVDNYGLARLLERFEEGLCRNFHYKYCRDLGQLAPVCLFLIKDKGRESYHAACRSLGMREGDIKVTALSTRLDWAEWFSGSYLEEMS
jgi:hypothetical protein